MEVESVYRTFRLRWGRRLVGRGASPARGAPHCIGRTGPPTRLVHWTQALADRAGSRPLDRGRREADHDSPQFRPPSREVPPPTECRQRRTSSCLEMVDRSIDGPAYSTHSWLMEEKAP